MFTHKHLRVELVAEATQELLCLEAELLRRGLLGLPLALHLLGPGGVELSVPDRGCALGRAVHHAGLLHTPQKEPDLLTRADWLDGPR